MSLLSCDNLSLSYDGKTVLSAVSFAVEKGQWLCIVGENGSGKSTLCKALLRLKAPDSGTITYAPELRRGGVGYLPQQTVLRGDFPATVQEIVLSGCQFRRVLPFYSRAQVSLARAQCARLGVLSLAHRPFAALSGGQRQRVLLARALCATQTLLVLDEPVAGLDPLVTHELYHLIRSLNREGLTVIMVSHDVRAAVGFASLILHLKNEPLFFGTAEEYRKSALGSAFLEGRHV